MEEGLGFGISSVAVGSVDGEEDLRHFSVRMGVSDLELVLPSPTATHRPMHGSPPRGTSPKDERPSDDAYVGARRSGFRSC